MDDTQSRMMANTANYKRTLDRITERYSKVSGPSAAIDVNWEHTTMKEIQRYMAKSQLELSRIEAESTGSGLEYSFTDSNKTNNSQITYQAEETNESIGSNNSIMDGASVMEQTQASGSLDDTRGNLTDVLAQPEDQDEDLERTLSSHGSSLMELYPQMIDQIGKARHRQHVSEAADSVLRRYRRMRQTNATARNATDRKPAPRGDSQHQHHRRHHQHQHQHLSRSCDEQNPKTAVESSAAAFHSLARKHSNRPEQPLPMWRAPPDREADRERRDEKRPVLVMDFYSPKPSRASMNQTFTVSRDSAPRSPLSGKPLRQPLPSPTQTLRFDRSNGPRVMESSAVHNSPVRQQCSFQTKWRHQEGYGGSPVAFARHSNTAYMEGYSRETKQARYNPSSPSLPKHSPLKSRRRLYHQDVPSPPRLGVGSPRLPSETGRPSFQRHRSFDSALRPGGIMRSPANLEEEFTKLYHKFVCQGQSPLSGRVPCRCCAGRLEASRRSSWFSASSLSALALSPHRSVLRKRVRELDQDKSPMSKRPRELTSSPGSLRHCKERLRNMCFDSRVPLSSTRLDFPGWRTPGVQRPAGDVRGEGRERRIQPVFLDF